MEIDRCKEEDRHYLDERRYHNTHFGHHHAEAAQQKSSNIEKPWALSS